MLTNSKWIWDSLESSCNMEMLLFRKNIEIEIPPRECLINISADSKFIVYVNGRLVARGPRKSDKYRRFFVTADIAPYLHAGKNCISAKVWHYLHDEYQNACYQSGPTSIFSSTRGGFLIQEQDSALGISTDATYRCATADYYEFMPVRNTPHLGYFERVDFTKYPDGWMQPDFNDSGWNAACELFSSDTTVNEYGIMNIWNLEPSNIPQPYEEKHSFVRLMRMSSGCNADWEALIHGGSIRIPAGTKLCLELDAGEYVTAFPMLTVGGGKGTVSILYSECYEYYDESGVRRKGIRDDLYGGKAELCGEYDYIYPAKTPHAFSPNNYRAFRFVRLEIEAVETLTASDLHYIKTGYPLQCESAFYGDPAYMKLWDISKRTLLSCMYDTYMDCPFYEQLQYCMDTMLQMIYTYSLSSDDRLARKAIDDFASGQMPSGLLASAYPSKIIQIIPSFSLYWIMMIENHYRYFGDPSIISAYSAHMDKVLRFYLSHINPRTGLLCKLGYWEFVDWVKEWEIGIPLTNPNDDNVIVSMMYVNGLRTAAYLNECIGRHDLASEYRSVADTLAENIRKNAYDEKDGLFADVPGKTQKSQHAQVWAVLSQTVTGDEARSLMLRCLENKNLSICSYCMSYFMFRALEAVDLYDRTEKLWDAWVQLTRYNITTWPEDPVNQRSDCHAWGALPLYEFSANILGVTPELPGYGAVRIQPKALWAVPCEGTVATCKGPVHVRMDVRDGIFILNIQAPPGIPLVIHMPDRRVHTCIYEHPLTLECPVFELSDEKSISSVSIIRLANKVPQ